MQLDLAHYTGASDGSGLVLCFVQEPLKVALPGKDPDRIRKDHPTIVFFDEAAIIERFEESYGVALTARPLKIVAISSAKPGEFGNITKDADRPEFLYQF